MISKRIRCGWVTQDPQYIAYHDNEWGRPQYDNIRLFEMLCLEGQQAGLSWLTVLKKRENYRTLFHQFDPNQIVKINNTEKSSLLSGSKIIRHKGKIESIINNAKCYLAMMEKHEDFSKFIWCFVENNPIENCWENDGDVPTETKISRDLSMALKKRGFKFVGPTICYAFMQACGLVNDHINGCFCKSLQ